MALHELLQDGQVVERIHAEDGSAEDHRLTADERWTAVPVQSQPEPERPSDSDKKATWQDYALARGVASYRVGSLTKDELIQEVG